MKKILNLIFCICILSLSLINVSAAEEQVFNKYEVVTALGFMGNDSNGEFNPNNKVTRSEFAEIVCKVLNVSVSSGSLGFKDVSVEDEKYNYIFSVCTIGLMEGYSAETFAPHEFIDYNEVIKVIIKMMGYEDQAQYHGGYPQGYNIVAADIDVPIGSGNITKGELANVIYKCMRAPTSEFSYDTKTTKKEGKTLLSKYHNIVYGEGIVTANCNTGIDSTTTAGIDSIQINGNSIECTTGDMDLLGYNVEFYVREENDSYKLVYAIPKKNVECNIKWDEFVPEASTMQKIFFESDTGRQRYIKLSDTVNLIYNGVYLFECTVNDLIPVYGETTFLDNNSDGIYDIAIVYNYKSMRVGRVMPNEEMIFNVANSDSISLKGLNIDDIIFENNDEIVGFNSIEELYDNIDIDSILLIAESKSGDKKVKIRSCNATLTKELNSKTEDYVLSGQDTYEFNPFAEGYIEQLMLGKNYVLYFDSYGLVSDCQLDNSDLKNYGYLIDAKSFEEEGEMVMRIEVYTIESEFKTYLSANKVIVKTGNSSKKYNSSEACDLLYENGKVKNQLIVYDVNNEGVLTSFEIANEAFGQKGEECFSLNYDNKKSYIPFGYYIVGEGNGSLPYEYSGLYRIQNAIRMTVPSSKEVDNEKLYKIDNISNMEQAGPDSAHMMIYDADSMGNAPIVVLVGGDVSGNVVDASVMVIDGIAKALNDDDEVVTVLKGYCAQKYVEYAVTDEELSQASETLEKGDIIFIWLNAAGEIQDYEYSFSYNEKKMYPFYDYFYNSSKTGHAINTHDTTGGTLTMIQRVCMYGVVTDIHVLQPNKYAVEITMNDIDSESLDGKTSWNFTRTIEVGTSEGNVIIYDGQLNNGNAQDLMIGDNIYFTSFRNYVGEKSACVVFR